MVLFCVIFGIAALGASAFLYHKLYFTENFITVAVTKEEWTPLCTLENRDNPYFIEIVNHAMNDVTCEVRYVQSDNQPLYDTIQIPAGTKEISSLGVGGEGRLL